MAEFYIEHDEYWDGWTGKDWADIINESEKILYYPSFEAAESAANEIPEKTVIVEVEK